MNSSAEIKLQRRRAAILFADVANYSRMMSRDEMTTALSVRDRIRLIRDMVGDYSGELIDVAGDGVFLLFETSMTRFRLP